jgi:hypothetical protein
VEAPRQSAAWLAEQRPSLSFFTHRIGTLFFLDLRQNGGLSIFER